MGRGGLLRNSDVSPRPAVEWISWPAEPHGCRFNTTAKQHHIHPSPSRTARPPLRFYFFFYHFLYILLIQKTYFTKLIEGLPTRGGHRPPTHCWHDDWDRNWRRGKHSLDNKQVWTPVSSSQCFYMALIKKNKQPRSVLSPLTFPPNVIWEVLQRSRRRQSGVWGLFLRNAHAHTHTHSLKPIKMQ